MEKQAFISYASEDAEKATSICRLLEQHGVKCWIAPRDITPGASYAEEIIKAIERTQALVLVMSENANNSPHVGLEVERAVSKAKTIFPVRIRECTPSKRLEYFVSGSQWIDAWASPLEMKVLQLANAIKALSETGRVTGTGEWKLGTEGTPRAAEEPPTLNAQLPTKAFSPVRSSGISPGIILGATLGLCVLLGAGFFFTRPEDSPKKSSTSTLTQIQTPSLRPERPVPPERPVSLVMQSSSSSIQLAMNASSSSQPAETALSLAIAKSLKDAESKIFSSAPTLTTQQSLANSSSPVIDPTLPLPKSSEAAVFPISTTPSPLIGSSSSVALQVAVTYPKPEPKVVKKQPAKPKEPVYPTVRAAKLAYKAGAITKYKYKEIVSRLEESYDIRVRQLKVDYRDGKISRDEYGRRVRELKVRIYG